MRINIRDDLFQLVEKVANDQSIEAETLINDWVKRQLGLVRERKIREETVHFRAQLGQLRLDYLGEYVAMRGGAVLDHGVDVNELYSRIKGRFGDEPVLIAPVTDSPVPIYQFRSPRVAQTDS